MSKEIRIPRRREYERRYEVQRGFYDTILQELELRVKSSIEAAGIHPVIKYRVKEFSSLFKKLLKLTGQTGTEGREHDVRINDVIGMRVLCPFLGDCKSVEHILQTCFSVLEIERKGADRSYMEFGYESTHILIELPEDIKRRFPLVDISICEIQVRTILQEAWAEVEHELVYKAQFDPKDDPMRRKLAAINANLSLSDLLFQDIREYQREFESEIKMRRGSFFSKIEEEMDTGLFEDERKDDSGSGHGAEECRSGCESGRVRLDGDRGPADEAFSSQETIDELLLKALQAHNKSDFSQATSIYSLILTKQPEMKIEALILTHRAMAFFAQSKYAEAYDDFSAALVLTESYKAFYYRGVVLSVLRRYDEAISDFDHALGMEPFHFHCLFRRAQAWYHQGDLARALSDCENALGLEPDDPTAERLRSLILKKLRM